MERPTPFAAVVFHGRDPNRELPSGAAEPHAKEPVMGESATYVDMPSTGKKRRHGLPKQLVDE
jgi:hypothetical protein